MVNIDAGKCIGCAMCTEVCSFSALTVSDGTVFFRDGAICNECGHCEAICPSEAIFVVGYDHSETIAYNKEKFNLPAENFLNALKFRRSTREFKDVEIAPEKINAILEAGRYSPTASNRQPLRYIVLDKKRRRKQAGSLMKFSKRLLTILSAERKPFAISLRVFPGTLICG